VNYVAQPEDEGVRYIRMMGPYDKYSVNWGYRFIPDANSKEDEKPTLDQWILDKAGNPWYEFGSGYGVADPRANRESLGDDHVKASEYGLANLKKVVPNLVAWTAEEGQDYSELAEVYRELGYMWSGYIRHVYDNVGGVHETRKTANQEGVVYQHVPKETQKGAVQFLNDHAFTNHDWLLNREILQRIEDDGAISRVKSLQTRTLGSLLDEDRLIRMIENESFNGDAAYTVLEMLDDLRTGIFSELYNSQPVDAYRRNLQRTYIDLATNSIAELDAEENKDSDVIISDVIPLMRAELEQLKTDITSRRYRTSDKMSRIHWNDLLARIDKAMNSH
jgi:hypothetical protein